MSWRGEKGGIAAAKAGHDVVMAPTSHTYFDYYQGPPEKEPLAIGGDLPLEKVYAYEPDPERAERAGRPGTSSGRRASSGPSTSRPRDTWSTWPIPERRPWRRSSGQPRDRRNYDSFLSRLDRHLERLKVMDVNYRPLAR